MIRLKEIPAWWRHTKTIIIEWFKFDTDLKGENKGFYITLLSIGFFHDHSLGSNERFTLFYISVVNQRFTLEICNIRLKIFFNSKWVYSIKIPFKRFSIGNMFKGRK